MFDSFFFLKGLSYIAHCFGLSALYHYSGTLDYACYYSGYNFLFIVPWAALLKGWALS